MNDTGATLIDGATYVSRVAPPLTVTGASMFGLPLSEWVYITTIFYTVIQTVYFIWKLVHKEKNKLKEEIKEAKENGS